VKREDIEEGPATSTCTKSGSSHSRSKVLILPIVICQRCSLWHAPSSTAP